MIEQPNNQDDPRMDNELHIGNWIITDDDTYGMIVEIGSSKTTYDYIIQTEQGTTIQISVEEIVEVHKAKMNLTEGIEGYHNSIGGESCPACHDQGCSQCDPNWMY